jgi:hypothetical protein
MAAPLHFGFRVWLTLMIITSWAVACGDPASNSTAGPKAQLVIQSVEGAIRIGEPVYANLILPKDSPLETGTLYRASCTSLEFKVEPQTGWHDPRSDWYYSGIPEHSDGRDGPLRCGVVGVMIGGPPPPPPQINFTLNHWIQFDRPGKYTISATYRTEYRSPQEVLDDPYDKRKTTTWVTLQTDPVEVEVLPESPDVAERANTAFIFLRNRFRDDDPVSGSSDSAPFPDWSLYSQSAAVVPLLAEFYEQSHWAGRFALIASPHQRLLVREMEAQLDSPRHPVSWDFLEILAFNRTRLDHPDLFGAHIQNLWTKEWEADSRIRNDAFRASLSKYTARLLTVIPQKDEVSQPNSFESVLLTLARWDLPGKTALRQQAGAEAARLWPKMKTQLNISEEEWKVIASPAMLPFLRQVVTGKKTFFGDSWRWFAELAPAEARGYMIAAAQRGDWEKAWSWGEMKAAEPSLLLDRHLIHALHRDTDDEMTRNQLRWLLLKFGGPELVKPVRGILQSETCLGEPELWSFLLKYKGAAAEEELVRSYKKALSSGGCDADLALQQVLQPSENWRGYWSLALESIVISQLGKEDSIAIGASNLLKQFGSPTAEDQLWIQLEKWHKSHPIRATTLSSQSLDLEQSLITAILSSAHWPPDSSVLARLQKLCFYDCQSLKWVRSSDEWQYLTVGDWPNGRHVYAVDALGSMPLDPNDPAMAIQRIPSGTRFVVQVQPGGARLTPTQIGLRYPELSRLFHERQWLLEDVSPFDVYGRCRSH